MTNKFVGPAYRELFAVLGEAVAISEKPEISKRDEARISVLLAKAAALKAAGANAPDDYCQRWFRAFLTGQPLPAPDGKFGEAERRAGDMKAGQQSITYTQGPQGGYLVPNEFANEVMLGMAQFDPLLDDNVVTLNRSKTFALRPWQYPGWDMTTYAATKVNESALQNAGTPPATSQAQLKSWTYRATLDATMEFEEDDFAPFMGQLSAAYGIAFARGIGADLITGNGSTAPQGVLTGAANSGYTTANSGKLVLTDFTKIYFSVNRIHRVAKKCGWIMSDQTYQMVREATDNNGRPLINIRKDKEEILGKPLYVSPSLEDSSSLGVNYIVFGDLSHYVVRLSGLSLVRVLQSQNAIEFGKALYTGRMRADAKVFDPSNGSVPPIVYATVHA
jgi:HK97 family phage major capsid protein